MSTTLSCENTNKKRQQRQQRRKKEESSRIWKSVEQKKYLLKRILREVLCVSAIAMLVGFIFLVLFSYHHMHLSLSIPINMCGILFNILSVFFFIRSLISFFFFVSVVRLYIWCSLALVCRWKERCECVTRSICAVYSYRPYFSP